MTKIFSPTLVQKNSDYWLRYWTEENPDTFFDGYSYLENIKDWEKSFKEVRIHPTQVEAFINLASFQNTQVWRFKEQLKSGIELPSENIKIRPEREKRLDKTFGDLAIVDYAFLVEGKKEPPEENDLKNRVNILYESVNKDLNNKPVKSELIAAASRILQWYDDESSNNPHSSIEWQEAYNQLREAVNSETCKCECVPENGEEIGWQQKRHCLKCNKELK